jgi:hypothetical protein
VTSNASGVFQTYLVDLGSGDMRQLTTGDAEDDTGVGQARASCEDGSCPLSRSRVTAPTVISHAALPR